MNLPKRYGESKIDKCPFCGRQATAKNKQNVAVCSAHINNSIDNMKCVCGSFLELRSGKFGAYFNCINCGNVNFKKAMEMNSDPFAKTEESAKNAELTRVQKVEANASVESIIKTGATFQKPFIKFSSKYSPSNDRRALEKKKSGVTIIHPDDPDYYDYVS